MDLAIIAGLIRRGGVRHAFPNIANGHFGIRNCGVRRIRYGAYDASVNGLSERDCGHERQQAQQCSDEVTLHSIPSLQPASEHETKLTCRVSPLRMRARLYPSDLVNTSCP